MSAPRTLVAPAPVVDLVTYQDDAIVSLALLKDAAGSVTVFAFDAGEGLSEHTTPYDALVYVVDGRATITVGGDTHRPVAGEIMRLPAGVPHAVRAEERFKMLLVMVRAKGNDGP